MRGTKLWDVQRTARFLGLTESELFELRECDSAFPKPIMKLKEQELFKENDVINWINNYQYSGENK